MAVIQREITILHYQSHRTLTLSFSPSFHALDLALDIVEWHAAYIL